MSNLPKSKKNAHKVQTLARERGWSHSMGTIMRRSNCIPCVELFRAWQGGRYVFFMISHYIWISPSVAISLTMLFCEKRFHWPTVLCIYSGHCRRLLLGGTPTVAATRPLKPFQWTPAPDESSGCTDASSDKSSAGINTTYIRLTNVPAISLPFGESWQWSTPESLVQNFQFRLFPYISDTK